jgi:acyl-coenzyme A synthetase/AMP-(fatty) acid ligase
LNITQPCINNQREKKKERDKNLLQKMKKEEEEGKAFTHRLIHQEATKLSQTLNRKKRSAVLFPRSKE